MKLGAFDSSEYPFCYYDYYDFEGLKPEKFLDDSITWRYCVIGNIIREHIDEEGILRYGSRAFPGGRKVYLSKSFWPDEGTITALGWNRPMSKFTREHISLDLITNIRCSRTYSKIPLETMSNFEFSITWWGNTPAEKRRCEEFAAALNEYKDRKEKAENA